MGRAQAGPLDLNSRCMLPGQVLWLDGLVGLGEGVSAKERGELLEVARERELRIRTDTLEVLLADIGQRQALGSG